MMAEGGTGGFDVGGEFGLIEGLFGRRVVLLGNDIVDRLFHLLLFFIYTSKIQLTTNHTNQYPLPSQFSFKIESEESRLPLHKIAFFRLWLIRIHYLIQSRSRLTPQTPKIITTQSYKNSNILNTLKQVL